MLLDLSKIRALLGSAAGSIGNIVTIIDNALGYTSWKRSPNIIYITSEQDMIDEGFLQTATARFPNGSYKTPDNKQVQPEGFVQHSLPIDWGVNSTSKAVTSFGSDGFIYTGGLGNGPTDFEDSAHFSENGNTTFNDIFCQTAGAAVTGLVVDDSTFLFDSTIWAFNKCFAFYGGTGNLQIESSGENIIFGQDTPSTFNNTGTTENVDAAFNGWFNSGAGFLATSGDIFDLTDLDAVDPGLGGSSRVRGKDIRAAMTNAAWAFFRVTDDDTITSGNFQDNELTISSVGSFIAPIDEKSINSIFAGNSANIGNTNRKGSMLTNNNTQQTTNPGVVDQPELLLVDNESAADTNSGWEVLAGGELRWADPNRDFEGDFTWGYGLTKIGGGANQARLYIYQRNGAAGVWAQYTQGGAPAETNAFTIESNDEVQGAIPFPVVATFDDRFRLFGSVDSINDDLLLVSQQGNVS